MSISRLPGLDGSRLSRRGLLAGLFVASAGALVACSSGGGTSGGNTAAGTTPAASGSTAGGGAAAATATVQMTDANKFDPATVTVSKGGSVTWKNTGSSQHSATCDPSLAANKADVSLPSGASAWNSNLLNPGQSFTQKFDTAGTYKYFCIPHESVGMVGTVVVQ